VNDSIRGRSQTRDNEIARIRRLANEFRRDAIRMSTRAGAGHPTSVMSCADLMAVLFSHHFRYDWSKPDHRGNDRLVLSKGHAGAVWYSALRSAGVIDEQELLTYRRHGSRLQGHPTPALPWVDVATGSLGQGLPAAVGMALGLRMNGGANHVWVLCGDGEMAEGSMWEALDKGSIYGLANLTPLIDVNGIGQSGRLAYDDPVATIERRVRAFGWHAEVVDGHDVTAIDSALEYARSASCPVAIIAKTVKGMGTDEVADRDDMHGVPFPVELAERSIAALLGDGNIAPVLIGPGPAPESPQPPRIRVPSPIPSFTRGEQVAIRDAFGQALVKLGEYDRLVVVDGDMAPSTRTAAFAREHPERFVQSYIAEQQMVGTAVGLSTCGFLPVLSTYGAFLLRAADFIRMAAVSRTTMILCGSHCGVEIGSEGPSQMALEDIALLRAIPTARVFYPSDATSMWRLLYLATTLPDITYIRITRNSYPVLYGSREEFAVGGCKIVRECPDDKCLVIAAGVTLHEAIAAADELASASISVRVLDLYSIKPLDDTRIREALRECDGRLVIVEDHYAEGGIGSAVLQAVAGTVELRSVRHLAVGGIPASATSAEQLRTAGISRHHIVDAVKEVIGEP
jgi:transketolase